MSSRCIVYIAWDCRDCVRCGNVYVCMQHGKEYNDAPVRKLSQSFCLDIVGGKAITPKQVQTYDHQHVKSNSELLFAVSSF